MSLASAMLSVSAHSLRARRGRGERFRCPGCRKPVVCHVHGPTWRPTYRNVATSADLSHWGCARTGVDHCRDRAGAATGGVNGVTLRARCCSQQHLPTGAAGQRPYKAQEFNAHYGRARDEHGRQTSRKDGRQARRPPLHRLDVCSCRNLAIDHSAKRIDELLPRTWRSLPRQ